MDDDDADSAATFVAGTIAGTYGSIAIDAAGNWSAPSTAKSVKTVVDSVTPSVPAGLAADAITGTTVTLVWSPSTDNVGVTAYEVFRGTVSQGTTDATSMVINGLTLGTTYALKVRARIDNKDNKLKAEMFVTAEVDADGEKELLVPTKAVFFQNEKYFLFIDESNGSYQRREVKTGDVRNNFVEILSGLNAGEKVVTEGTLMLQQVMQPRRVQK